MLVRTMEQLEAEGRVISISHGKASAVRLLTKSDGVGFSVSEARADGGRSSDLWYKNHWEANFVRSGHGVLEDRSTGEQWPLGPRRPLLRRPDRPAPRHPGREREHAHHQRVQSAHPG